MNAMKKLAVILQTPEALAPLLWGDTGGGKSAKIRQMAEKLGWTCITSIAATKLPEDFAGCLVPTDGGRPERVPDLFVYDVSEAAARGENVLLFLDEISCAPPAVQSALLTAVLDLRFGDVQLSKDKVRIVSAANPADIAAGGFELADSMAARFTHVEEEEPVEGFIDWLIKGDGAGIETPRLDLREWEMEYSKNRMLLAAYLRRFPEQGRETQDQRAGREPKRFACSRTWDNGIRLYSAATVIGDDELAVQLVEDAVGPLGIQFVAWAQEQDVPSPEEMLKDPSVFSHDSTRPDRTFAALSCLASYIVSSNGNAKKNWSKAWPVLSRAVDTGASADEVTPAVMVLATNRPKGGLTDKACLVHVKRVAELVKDVQQLAEGFVV